MPMLFNLSVTSNNHFISLLQQETYMKLQKLHTVFRREVRKKGEHNIWRTGEYFSIAITIQQEKDLSAIIFMLIFFISFLGS